MAAPRPYTAAKSRSHTSKRLAVGSTTYSVGDTQLAECRSSIAGSSRSRSRGCT